MINITPQERETLRTLAARYMSYALSDENNENRRLWYALNRLQMEKPMITIDQMPWNELAVDKFLLCTVENRYFRRVEWMLRSEIYKWEHLRVDMVLNPYILLPRPFHDSGWGISNKLGDHRASGSVTSRTFVNQFEEMEDVEKIQMPVITADPEAEAEIWQTAEEIFAGVAPLRWQGIILHCGIWDTITQWMGIDNCFIEFMDRPELMHAIMDRLTNALLEKIRQINELGLYDIHSHMCHCSYTYDDNLPPKGSDPDRPVTSDGWAFGLAQLFTSVSPAITAEFEVPYMQKVFPHFGAVYYGCCESLDDRLDILDRMPNIRKISCSPWSNRENFAANLPKKYIMSNKPNPALLAEATLDEDAVRADLRRTIKAAKDHGLCLELLLKDISTVKNDPQRLWRWAEIAAEETKNSVL